MDSDFFGIPDDVYRYTAGMYDNQTDNTRAPKPRRNPHPSYDYEPVGNSNRNYSNDNMRSSQRYDDTSKYKKGKRRRKNDNDYNNNNNRNKRTRYNENDDEEDEHGTNNKNDDDVSISDVDVRGYNDSKGKNRKSDDIGGNADFSKFGTYNNNENNPMMFGSNRNKDMSNKVMGSITYEAMSLQQMELETSCGIGKPKRANNNNNNNSKPHDDNETTNKDCINSTKVSNDDGDDNITKNNECKNTCSNNNGIVPYSSHGYNNIMKLLEFGNNKSGVNSKLFDKSQNKSFNQKNENDNNEEEEEEELDTVGYKTNTNIKSPSPKNRNYMSDEEPNSNSRSRNERNNTKRDFFSEEESDISNGILSPKIINSLKERFGRDLRQANMTIETMLAETCPLCMYGSRDYKGVLAIEIQKIKELYRNHSFSTPPQSLALKLCFTWNNRVFKPVYMRGRAMMPLTYDMAMSHITRPHIFDAALTGKRAIDDLTSIENGLKSMIFLKYKKEVPVSKDDENVRNDNNSDPGILLDTEYAEDENGVRVKKETRVTYRSTILKDYLTVLAQKKAWLHSKRSDTVFNTQRRSGFLRNNNSSVSIQT